MPQSLLVNRQDFSDIVIVNQPDETLKPDHIRVSVGPWALTANNITYMVVGEQIGDWKFFEPRHYDIEMDGFGRMPVWGYARVTQSNCPDITPGMQLYGFFPVTDQFDMKPVKITPLGFQDGAAHRTALHAVYNSYNFTASDPTFGKNKNMHPILRPLFTTSFLIEDFLADESFFGAEQVLLLSASSKTALGTAFCLKQEGAVKVTGLTSDANAQFVRATGFYETVETYETITNLNPDIKTVIVDMAGNGDVTTTIYDHFEENIVYNCMVGKSHWRGAGYKTPKLGAPAVMFFAPDRAKKRFADWGAGGFAQKLAARWNPFCETASGWLTLNEAKGVENLLKVYKDFLDGKANPSQGYIFTL